MILLVLLMIRAVVPKPDLYARYTFSNAVYDKNSKLLKLSLTIDDKYRLFVPLKDIPQHTKQALLLYEDRGFYFHFGVNPFSFFRAVFSMASGGRKQGASTITMQVARIVYQIDSSTVIGKIMQILRALQIEMYYSKEQILEAYFNLAPYGGNIEGIGAASLIYFMTDAKELNLPQSTALTVIPQNPSNRLLLTEKGRNNNLTARKRLQKMWLENYEHSQNGYLDMPLKTEVFLPDFAPHFVRRVLQNHSGKIVTTLDINLQQKMLETIQNYIAENKIKGVSNAAAVLVDRRDMSVSAYVGSADFYNEKILGQVDGVSAKRSSGSTLKPFIYALALEQGKIHPLTILKDVPQKYGFYSPENFDRSYMGLLDATRALNLSRNVPAVELLMQTGEENFYNFLQKNGIKLAKPASYYGLAMALGGVEVSAENLAAMYAMLADGGIFSPLRFVKDETKKEEKVMQPEAAFLAEYMLLQNKENYNDEAFFVENNEPLTAWKTGTSYSYKDAWTAGIFGDYVLVVWIGNFDGKSNQSFVGRTMAAPLFFRLIKALDLQNDIKNPEDVLPKNLNIFKVKVCSDTGDLADAFCENKKESYFISGVTNVKMSGITRLIPIDRKSGLRACRHRPPYTVLESYNFWPDDVVKALSNAGIGLKTPPEFMEDCADIEDFKHGNAPKILSPNGSGKMLIDASKDKIVLKATADSDAKEIYWFVNNKFVGITKTGKILEIPPVFGDITVKAVDDIGRVESIKINSVQRE